MTETSNKVISIELVRAIHAYAEGTGIHAFAIDAQGNVLHESGEVLSFCGFCSSCNSTRGTNCPSVYLYGAYQAERFGGRYVFFCPSGLTFWVSPMPSPDSGALALLAGPILMVEPEEFLLDEFFRDQGLAESDMRDLRSQASRIPVVTPSRVSALSDLLYIVTAQGSPSLQETGKARENWLIESDISSVIHRIKAEGPAVYASYPFDKEKELLTMITLGDKANAQRLLNELLGSVFFSSGRDFTTIKARTLELVVLLSRAAMEGGADPGEIFGLNHRYLNDIQGIQSVEALTLWLSKIMARFTDCVFNLSDIRHRDIIFQVINYIKQHFNGEITLDDVAKHVHFNPSYLSRVFKEEMKCTFVSYVNKLRIDTAKRLLLDTTIPLLEVSGMVGYDEQSYFTRVFKKAVGVTPGRFRESRGLAMH